MPSRACCACAGLVGVDCFCLSLQWGSAFAARAGVGSPSISVVKNGDSPPFSLPVPTFQNRQVKPLCNSVRQLRLFPVDSRLLGDAGIGGINRRCRLPS
uniref:Putative secreted protein n=1 Tax=Ixodes ricinus TaxID=34613 RepID=A0A6B0UGB6_IXORI